MEEICVSIVGSVHIYSDKIAGREKEKQDPARGTKN
jgi:hypothetical protein